MRLSCRQDQCLSGFQSQTLPVLEADTPFAFEYNKALRHEIAGRAGDGMLCMASDIVQHQRQTWVEIISRQAERKKHRYPSHSDCAVLY
ncbi:hypothetical protein D3C76_168990 [compost metagenome]